MGYVIKKPGNPQGKKIRKESEVKEALETAPLLQDHPLIRLQQQTREQCPAHHSLPPQKALTDNDPPINIAKSEIKYF